MTWSTLLLPALMLPPAHALCVITETGYRECYRPLDREVVARVLAFDPMLSFAPAFAPPARIDVLAEFRAFAARTERDEEERPVDRSWAAALTVPDGLRERTLATYARLVIESVRVDPGHSAAGAEYEIPFVAQVAWTRGPRTGTTRVHGRVRQVRLDEPLTFDDQGDWQRDLNARLGRRLKIDLLKGPRGLAPGEGERRRLVREVLFPAVVGHGLAALLDEALRDYSNQAR